MNAFELKGGLYDMIARVNDKELLKQIHSMVSQLINQNPDKTDFWDEMSINQQKELELAINESYKEENLISHESALKQIREWVKD